MFNGGSLPVQTDSAIMNSKKALMPGFMVLVCFMGNAAAGAEPQVHLEVVGDFAGLPVLAMAELGSGHGNRAARATDIGDGAGVAGGLD
jgi:hypothetical protein